MCTIFKENTAILSYLVHMHSSKGVHTISGGTQHSGMKGKPILGTEGYNGLFALPLGAVHPSKMVHKAKIVRTMVHKCERTF